MWAGILIGFEPIQNGRIAVSSRHDATGIFGIESRLLSRLDFAKSGILQVERQVNEIPQIVVSTNVGFVEHSVQV